MSKRSPNNIDIHVGQRIRMRRLMLGMSQVKLGAHLGITFQQVQKYEKGSNRVGASRLQHMAEILGASVSFFFEGMPEMCNYQEKRPQSEEETSAGSQTPDYITRFFATADGLALSKAFMDIHDLKLRRLIVDLVEEIASGQSQIGCNA